VLKLQTAAHDYAAKGDEVGWNRFLSAHKASLDGLSEWRNLLAGEAKMEDAAQKTADYLTAYGKLGDRFHKEFMELQKAKLHTDKGFETLLASMEEAMEKIIDAASAVQERASFLAVSFTVAGIVLGVALAVLITRWASSGLSIALSTDWMMARHKSSQPRPKFLPPASPLPVGPQSRRHLSKRHHPHWKRYPP